MSYQHDSLSLYTLVSLPVSLWPEQLGFSSQRLTKCEEVESACTQLNSDSIPQGLLQKHSVHDPHLVTNTVSNTSTVLVQGNYVCC